MIGIGLGLAQIRGNGVATAPDYVEPVGDTPVDPVGDPVPPTDTPTDPVTDAPEPGIDPDFVLADRIDIADSGQTAIRTTNDPGTFGVAYIAAAVSGDEYFEYDIQNGTPRNATFAIGITTLDMPLNGIPGERATEIAWWSDGTIRQNDATLIDLGSAGQLGRGDLAGIAINGSGEVFLYKNCAALNSGATVGTLAPAGAIYPFAGLFSAKTRINMNFSTARFDCTVPDGFFPIGQVPAATLPAGYVHHYDLSLNDFTTSGSNIIVIPDQVGTANLTTTQFSSWPQTGRTINGLPVADFQDSDLIHATAVSPVGFDGEDQPFTVAIVADVDNGIATGSEYFLAFNTSSGTAPFYGFTYGDSNGKVRALKRDVSSVTATGASAAGVVPFPNEGPQTFIFRSSGTTVDIWLDGVKIVDAAAFNVGAMTGTNRITMGAWFSGVSQGGNANAGIGEVVIYNTSLSDTDVGAVYNYMAAKWIP